jgi:hypothetical protein
MTTMQSTNKKLSNLELGLKDAQALRKQLADHDGKMVLLAMSLAGEIVSHVKWSDPGYAPAYGRLMTSMMHYGDVIDVLSRFANQWLPNRIAIIKEGRNIVRFDIKEKRVDFLYPSSIGVDADSMIKSIEDGINQAKRALEVEKQAIKEDKTGVAKARKAGKELEQSQAMQDTINKATAKLADKNAVLEVSFNDLAIKYNVLLEAAMRPSHKTVAALQAQVSALQSQIVTMQAKQGHKKAA